MDFIANSKWADYQTSKRLCNETLCNLICVYDRILYLHLKADMDFLNKMADDIWKYILYSRSLELGTHIAGLAEIYFDRMILKEIWGPKDLRINGAQSQKRQRNMMLRKNTTSALPKYRVPTPTHDTCIATTWKEHVQKRHVKLLTSAVPRPR